MRVTWASKWSLGIGVVVVVVAAAGGCQQNQAAPPAAPRAASAGPVPQSVATADAATVTAPPAAGEAVTGEPVPDVTQSDVIGWTVRGVTDDVILDRIGHGRSSFRLSAGDEMRLRDAGVSDDVIRAMKASVWN